MPVGGPLKGQTAPVEGSGLAHVPTADVSRASAPFSSVVYVGVPTKSEASEQSLGPTAVKAVGDVLASAAWPVGIVIVALIFRRQLEELIGRIRSFKAPGFEVTTEDLINRLPPVIPGDDKQQEEVAETAQLAPIDAIVTSWVSVERAIGRLYDRLQMVALGSMLREPTPLSKLSFLAKAGAIGPSLVQEIRQLSFVRNKAVHDPDERVSQEAVRTYVANARAVVSALDAVPGDPTV